MFWFQTSSYFFRSNAPLPYKGSFVVESLLYAWGKAHAKPEGSLGSSLAIESIVAVESLELAQEM